MACGTHLKDRERGQAGGYQKPVRSRAGWTAPNRLMWVRIHRLWPFQINSNRFYYITKDDILSN